MKRTRTIGWTSILVAVAVCGCGESGGGRAAAGPSADGPAQAVFQFLEAVRTGNDQGAQGMLTRLAQEKTAELEMMVAPPGSDTASFEVGEVELLGDQNARVASSWTDLEHDGGSRTDYITWLVRRDSSGWRISGMATELVPGEGPVVLNFENPEEIRNHLAGGEDSGDSEDDEPEEGDRYREARRPDNPFQDQSPK